MAPLGFKGLSQHMNSTCPIIPKHSLSRIAGCMTVACPVAVGETSRMEIIGANPVLAVHDLKASAEWYGRVLGCEATEVEAGNWVFCQSGSTRFMLESLPRRPTGFRDRGSQLRCVPRGGRPSVLPKGYGRRRRGWEGTAT
jgi:hypothetical protein